MPIKRGRMFSLPLPEVEEIEIDPEVEPNPFAKSLFAQIQAQDDPGKSWSPEVKPKLPEIEWY